jgi:hypothetical protein
MIDAGRRSNHAVVGRAVGCQYLGRSRLPLVVEEVGSTVLSTGQLTNI